MKKYLCIIIVSLYPLFGEGIKSSIGFMGYHQHEISSILQENNFDYGFTFGYEKQLYKPKETSIDFSLGLEVQVPKEIKNYELAYGITSTYLKIKLDATDNKIYMFLNYGFSIWLNGNKLYNDYIGLSNSSWYGGKKIDIGLGRNFKRGAIELSYISNNITIKSETDINDIFAIHDIYDKYISIAFIYDIFN